MSFLKVIITILIINFCIFYANNADYDEELFKYSLISWKDITTNSLIETFSHYRKNRKIFNVYKNCNFDVIKFKHKLKTNHIMIENYFVSNNLIFFRIKGFKYLNSELNLNKFISNININTNFFSFKLLENIINERSIRKLYRFGTRNSIIHVAYIGDAYDMDKRKKKVRLKWYGKAMITIFNEKYYKSINGKLNPYFVQSKFYDTEDTRFIYLSNYYTNFGIIPKKNDIEDNF